jgi:hypothetical protein
LNNRSLKADQRFDNPGVARVSNNKAMMMASGLNGMHVVTLTW